MPKFVDKTVYTDEKPVITRVTFYLSKSAFYQTMDDLEGRYIPASPDNPVEVVFPSHMYREGKGWYETKETPFLTRKPVPEPVDVRPNVKKPRRPKNVAKKVPDSGKRAADQ